MASPQTGNTSINYDELHSLTNRYYIPKMKDVIFKGNPLFKRLHKKGTKIRGGTEIHQPLMYTAGRGSSFWGYDTLDTTHEDDFTVAIYKWKQDYEPISISRAEELQNMGSKEAMMNLVQHKVRKAGLAIRDRMGTALFADGTGNNSKDLDGLEKFLPDDPTSSNTVGGIDQKDYSWWQNKVQQVTNSTIAISDVIDLCNAIANEGEKPNFGVTSYQTLAKLESLVDASTQYVNTSRADLGYDNILVHGVTIANDSHCPTDNLYLLNDEYIDFVSHRLENFRFEKWAKPVNQAARVAFVFWMGNLTMSNMRMQGKIFGMSYS